MRFSVFILVSLLSACHPWERFYPEASVPMLDATSEQVLPGNDVASENTSDQGILTDTTPPTDREVPLDTGIDASLDVSGDTLVIDVLPTEIASDLVSLPDTALPEVVDVQVAPDVMDVQAEPPDDVPPPPDVDPGVCGGNMQPCCEAGLACEGALRCRGMVCR